MLNPQLWTTGAVAVSNTVDPNFTQATLLDIEAAIAVTPEPGGQAMSRLYLTPTNPYTAGVGLISGAPPADNYTHYEQILLDATTGGYQPTASGAYIAKTHESSTSDVFNRGFNLYENNPKFLAAKAEAGGLGGGVVFFINQGAESLSHLRHISGSNLHMTVYVRPTTGGVIALGGQVVLNPAHNTTAALDTSNFGPAYADGVQQIQNASQTNGNEQGFWVTGQGDNTAVEFWNSTDQNSISTTYNPDATFHVHTHPGTNGPSYADFLASALVGLPGAVITSGGAYSYGFKPEMALGANMDPAETYVFLDSRLLDSPNNGYNSNPQGQRQNSFTDRWVDFINPGYGSKTPAETAAEPYKSVTERFSDCLNDPVGAFETASSSTFVTNCLVQSQVDWTADSLQRENNYGGPRPDRSYTDNGRNYGGDDGNTAPDGSAINGF